MFPLTPDEKARQEMNSRLHRFTKAMIDMTYWYHEPLLQAYKRIDELEKQNTELKKQLENSLFEIVEMKKSFISETIINEVDA